MSVSQKLQQLIRLQNLDDEIGEHKKLLAEIPVQLDADRSELEAEKKTLSSAKEEIDTLQKNRKAIESEVQGENDHMAKAKTKLTAVKTNKEYTAILAEVDGIKVRVAGLEDKELEIMEVLEEKQKEIPEIEKKCKEEDAHFQEYKTKKDGELSRMKQELDVFIAKREGVMGQLPDATIQRYEKVARSCDGKAVVLLLGNICQGCFRQVLPQMVIDVKVGASIQQCSNCIRFLYWEEKTGSNDFPEKKRIKLQTTNIQEYSSKTKRLLKDIEDALRDKFGSQCTVESPLGSKTGLKGSTSIKSQGEVQAKLIPQGWPGDECIMIGVSAKILDQNWGSYEFPGHFEVGVGNNNQPFDFMDLQEQTAIDDSIKIIGMLFEKLKPS